ncbi:YrdB family protein [Mesorhizobium dulcispinae]|uniref:YrdB family protein n=1 Tax=Mesorhizobium dulcispinae TaxID=3072316 RepID=UPI002A240644|nr:YrdB family protein [Mesorhizobium sp. VK23D]MDX8520140.1 YrdB family protein [Mesorhizobium sp. VK23D]
MMMGNAWWNLTLRFLLELSALLGLGMAGWTFSTEFWRWILAITLPLVAAVFWGTFAVLNDPSRSGQAPVPVSGAVRLVLELIVLFGGAAGYYLAGHAATGIVMALLIALSYAFSLDRLGWLLRQ